MFYYISGKVALTEAAMVVIDAGGVGYAINTSYTSSRSVKTGEQATFTPTSTCGRISLSCTASREGKS